MAKGYRIGVDIGGTFTDLVLLEEGTGRLVNEKVLTTPHDPEQAVLSGVASILAKAGVAAADALPVIHGTTLVANALIERKGVKVALVTTAGFRDVLEIGKEWRYDIYDLSIRVPEPLVPRALRFEVGERMLADGTVRAPLDEAGMRKVAAAIAASGVGAVAICFLHAYANDAHERRAEAILREVAPGLRITRASALVPELGEYERASTAVANAYVQPVFDAYVQRLEEGLQKGGLRRGLYLMLSDGGTVTAEAARAFPIRLVQSGPAGGAQAAALFGALASERRVMAFDMGGTTAKACLIEDGEPDRAIDFEVARVFRFKRGSGLPLKVPVADMIEIGAGGGSIARIDRLGLVQVGPDSSGSDPGPACYGLGGTLPTVSDADLMLGYLDAGSFLGGDMVLKRELAEQALSEHLGKPLGMSAAEAAWAIHETVNEAMAQAASIHALEKAKRVSDYALVALGGAGPVHACHVARKMGVKRVIAPLGAGVASALGMLAAPTAFAIGRAQVAALSALDLQATAAMLGALEQEGRDLVAGAGVPAEAVAVRRTCLMRYAGQGHEVEATVPDAFIAAGDRAALADSFAAAYRALYGRTESAEPETVSWRVVVSGPRPRIDLAAAPRPAGSSRRVKGERPCWVAGQGFVPAAVIDRYALAPGDVVEGPALVEEREATLVLPPGARARCDAALSLIIEL